MHLSHIVDVLRFTLGFLFLYAGWMKGSDPASLSHAIAKTELLPHWAIMPASLGLPAVEMALGGCIFATGRLRRAGSLGLVLLLVIFTAVLAWALGAGMEFDCTCFGEGSILNGTSPGGAVARNSLLLCVALGVYVYEVSRQLRRDVAREEANLEMPSIGTS